MKNERTAKDEADYNAHLRREAPITSEVVVELREQNKHLWGSQARLLTALLAADAALRFYRELALNQAVTCAGHDSHCIPGCSRHVWNTVDGWHRANEVKP